MRKICFGSFFILIAICLALLSGCKGKDGTPSFESLEANRQTAIDNSSWNATVFRNTYFPKLKIKGRGDSSIKEDCPTGDGWATVDLIDDTGNAQQVLKCSTVSATIACMTVADFQTRYADGKCDTELPNPLPKAVK